ncbi:hypothetical protein J7I98_31400 [Streptomyces sp. ISL-98]|uniref:hypothetical protein n=1 Tax=Streptomyces sp. ISL-98 TaxID=2819192 RepID=UPI001BEB93CF|nr:hypothetical protein [Streptomyces sp. ISL-98]MBT2510283.1 hypothetical protein [Streptomyces sp. ISL-98]
MSDLTASQRKAAAKEIIDAAQGKALPLTEDELESTTISFACKEAQNTLRAARESADSAMIFGSVINRTLKISQGVALSGNWSTPAQDSLRAAVLFAGAGLDRALKVLVEDTLHILSESDEVVREKFESFAQDAISRRGENSVDPAALVDILLSSGQHPRTILVQRWKAHLSGASAQSVERVEEIATALGVTDSEIRKRVNPSAKGSALRAAFAARNKIAHELDITKPKADVRARLENIRATRKADEVRKHVTEMLDTGRVIINDVSGRLDGE